MTRRQDEELEGEQLRDYLRQFGFHVNDPDDSVPPPMHVLDPELEAIYQNAITRPRSPWSRAVRKLGQWFDRHHALALGAVAASVLAIIGGLVFRSAVQAPPAAEAATPPMLHYEYTLTKTAGQELGAPAAPILENLAAIAASQPTPTPTGSATSQHVSSFSWLMAPDWEANGALSTIQPTRTDSWLNADGSVFSVEVRSNYQLDKNGQLIPASTSHPTMSPIGTGLAPAGTLNASLLRTFSRDPAILRAQLLKYDGADPPATATEQTASLFDAIDQIHQNYVIPPDLESAMWHVLAGESTLRSLGTVTDRGGVSGMAIAMWDDADHENISVYIVSSRTGYLAGTEDITFDNTSEPDLRVPAVTAFTNFNERNWTQEPTAGKAASPTP